MANETLASRNGYLYLAKVAEQAERYEETLDFMEKVFDFIPINEEPTVEERTVLFETYKHVLRAKRGAWIILSSNERKKKFKGNEDHLNAIKEFKSKIETELSKMCNEVLALLDSRLIPCAIFGESMVFYLRSKGDYCRYLAEFKTGAQRKEAAKTALNAYKDAQDMANVILAPTDPSRLVLYLNFSVFCYDILNSHDRAYSLAKQAYDEADAEIDTLEDSNNSILAMQLLLDNLTSWTSAIQDD